MLTKQVSSLYMYALLHHYQKETETIYLHIVYVRTGGRTNVWKCVCMCRWEKQFNYNDCAPVVTHRTAAAMCVDRRVVTFRIMIYEYYPTHLFSLSRQIKRTKQNKTKNTSSAATDAYAKIQNTKSQNWRMNEWNSAFSSTYIYKLYHPCTYSVSVCAQIYFWLCIINTVYCTVLFTAFLFVFTFHFHIAYLWKENTTMTIKYCDGFEALHVFIRISIRYPWN